MYSYIGKRLLVAIPTLLIISIFVFSLQKLLPGDPVLAMAGEERDPQVLEYLREKYHLNDPVPIQYLQWAGAALQGDLGISLRTNQPVLKLIDEELAILFLPDQTPGNFALLGGHRAVMFNPPDRQPAHDRIDDQQNQARIEIARHIAEIQGNAEPAAHDGGGKAGTIAAQRRGKENGREIRREIDVRPHDREKPSRRRRYGKTAD